MLATGESYLSTRASEKFSSRQSEEEIFYLGAEEQNVRRFVSASPPVHPLCTRMGKISFAKNEISGGSKNFTTVRNFYYAAQRELLCSGKRSRTDRLRDTCGAAVGMFRDSLQYHMSNSLASASMMGRLSGMSGGGADTKVFTNLSSVLLAS